MAVPVSPPYQWIAGNIDIVLEVFDYFDHRLWDDVRDGTEAERTSALSRLARTCRAFFGLAIPILWRRLRSIAPLFRLLGLYIKGRHLHTWVGELYPYEWCRFCAYASHVTELNVIDAQVHLEPSVWHKVRHMTRGRPVLPNLRELHWRITLPECPAPAHLISPSVQRLVILCTSPSRHLSLVEQHEWGLALWMPLSITLPMASQLSHVSLSYAGFHSSAVLSLISKLPYLRSFQLHIDRSPHSPPIPAHDLFLFLTAERLEKLDFDCEVTLPEDNHHNRVAHYPSRVSLCMSHAPGSNPCYSSFASPNLTSLTIHTYRDATLLDFHATCVIWTRNFPSLDTLICELAPTLTSPRSLIDTIAPLLRLRGMRQFKLTFALDAQLILHDDGLIDVARSWPRLTSFTLIASSGEPLWDADGPGVRTLDTFARHCPALIRLWLPHLVFRARDVAAAKRAPAPGEGGHRLRELFARWVDADDYRLAAAWVDGIFPHVENREGMWGGLLELEESVCEGEEKVE